MALERSGQWERADADLQRALELKPDQPLVLNYLGYSWIDRGQNLDRGLKMIEKAVELRPEDGYIIDSLGWAHYRLGNYSERDRIPRKGDRAGTRGPDDQRPSRGCLLARRAHRRGALPMAAGLAVQPPGRRGQADREQARTRPRHPRLGPRGAAARRLSLNAKRKLGAGVPQTVLAPAKINLYLHVTGRRDDGYHLLDSLVAFADIGDRVTASPATRLSLAVEGPEAAALAGLGDDNLVMRAARRFAVLTGESRGAALRLEKRLPIAAGIGGGSADASATLRALAALWGHAVDDDNHGARGRARRRCARLSRRPTGLGRRHRRAHRGRAGLARAWDRARQSAHRIADPGGIPRPHRPVRQTGPLRPGAARRRRTLVELLAARRNDLTEAALASVPEIGAVLDRLAALARCADRTDERQRRDLLCIVRRPRRRGRRGRGSQRGGTRLLVGRRRPAARTAAGRGYQLLGARVVGAVAGTETGIAVTRECGAGSGGASRIAASTWEAMFSARFLSPS